MHTHAQAHPGTHALQLAPPCHRATRRAHGCPQTSRPPPAAEATLAACWRRAPLTPALPPPQALLGLPRELEEVLVVVGGRALEEEEEDAEQLAPRPGNFAFYDPEASE